MNTNIKALFISLGIVAVAVIGGSIAFLEPNGLGLKRDELPDKKSTSELKSKSKEKDRTKYFIREGIRGECSPEYKELVAVIGKQEYPLICEYWVSIIDSKDFDSNGLLDVLVSSGPGGVAVGPIDILISNLGMGKFSEIELDFSVDKIEKWKGQWSMVATSPSNCISSERFVFSKNGEVKRVEKIESKRIKSLIEVTSDSASDRLENPDLVIHYDIDGDGKEDKIVYDCFLNGRGVTLVSGADIKFSNGKEFNIPEVFDRIGILASKTNGVHDLVTDCNQVYHWTGKKYNKAPKSFD